MEDKKWYVVHTYSGYENKVKVNLEKRVETMNMDDRIFSILVPMEEEMENKGGKRRIVQKKIFPGYILVEMLMTDESWYVVRNTPGVTGFVGSAGAGLKPTPLLDSEVKNIMRRMGVAATKPKIDFELNESVRVTSGPFENFIGSIDEINMEKLKIKVLVNMFGRETPVELEFDQIEKL